jgi:hypothetical protein
MNLPPPFQLFYQNKAGDDSPLYCSMKRLVQDGVLAMGPGERQRLYGAMNTLLQCPLTQTQKLMQKKALGNTLLI